MDLTSIAHIPMYIISAGRKLDNVKNFISKKMLQIYTRIAMHTLCNGYVILKHSDTIQEMKIVC